MQYCLVTQQISAYLIDGEDTDRDPDSHAVNGRILFTPMVGGSGDSVSVDDGDTVRTVKLTAIEARVSDGQIMHRGGEGVRLAAGGVGSNPPVVRWRASYHNLVAGTKSLTLRDVVFDAVPGGSVNLASVTPVAGSSGVGITQGTPGEDGETPRIVDGTWWIGDTDTGVVAEGQDGVDGVDGAPGEVTQAALDARIPANAALRVDTSVGSRIFAGDTMIHGDTGWRDISTLTEGIDFLRITRIGNRVIIVGGGTRVATGGTYLTKSLPAGFIPGESRGTRGFMVIKSAMYPVGNVSVQNRLNYQSPPYAGSVAVGDQVTFEASWTTTDPWPSILPGTPA